MKLDNCRKLRNAIYLQLGLPAHWRATGLKMKQKITASGCADRLKAMADPDRLRIVTALRTGPKAVGELAESLPMELANVSHHLGVLRVSQIVLVEKQGRQRVYRLNPEVSPNPCCRPLNLAAAALSLTSLGSPRPKKQAILSRFLLAIFYCVFTPWAACVPANALIFKCMFECYCVC